MKKLALLTRIRRKHDQILKNKSGQSTTEYILILAIVVMIASKLKGTLMSKVVGSVDKLDFDKVMSDGG